ncbi:MAG: transposase [Planctomycetota bacterium]|nr:transposase [Planctomycetota bacterium]
MRSRKRYFHGVREHLIVSLQGHILYLVEVPGNRHDVNGLYALMRESFRGHLIIADNAYWPKQEKRAALAAQGITSLTHVTTGTSNLPWKKKNNLNFVGKSKEISASSINSSNAQNRNPQHYLARRWTKAVAYNATRLLNHRFHFPSESYLHFHLAA